MLLLTRKAVVRASKELNYVLGKLIVNLPASAASLKSTPRDAMAQASSPTAVQPGSSRGGGHPEEDFLKKYV